MTKRDSSVFIGTKMQVVDWDGDRQLNSETDSVPNSTNTGFFIMRPISPDSHSLLTRYPLLVLTGPFIAWTLGKWRDVLHIYNEADGCRSGWPTSCGHNPVFAPIGQRMLRKDVTEFLQDLRARGWADLWHGDVDSRLQSAEIPQWEHDRANGLRLTVSEWILLGSDVHSHSLSLGQSEQDKSVEYNIRNESQQWLLNCNFDRVSTLLDSFGRRCGRHCISHIAIARCHQPVSRANMAMSEPNRLLAITRQ